MSNCHQASIKYDVDKPTFGYTAKTTEFDDELIRRGIISKEQAIIRKGATVSEAYRIIEEAQKAASDENPQRDLVQKHLHHKAQDDTTDSDYDSENEEDRVVLLRYQQRRLEEYQNELSDRHQETPFGEVIPISRSDWKKEVNDVTPNGTWVVVNLTSEGNCTSVSHWNECKKVQDATHGLANRYPNVKFVSIKSTSAIENWPSEHLPTIFLYRNGVMQHQLVGLQDFGGAGINEPRLEWILATKYGVLTSDLENEPPKSPYDKCLSEDASARYAAKGMVGSLMTFAEESDQGDTM